MEIINQYLLGIHIASGMLALVSGPVAMLNQTGNQIHRLSGKIFFYAMTVVFVTAVYLSIYKNIPFLLMIAVFSYHNIVIAYRSLYLKKLGNGQNATTLDWVVSITTAIFNLSLLLWGIYTTVVLKNSFGIVALVFGGFGFRNTILEIRRYTKGNKGKNDWLFHHIGGMIGGYIAALTAFLVNVVEFEPQFVLWLAPTVVFTPVIIFTIGKFKKKFNKGKEVTDLAKVKF